MRAVDPRLLRHARAARTYLVVTVLLGLVVPGLIVGAFADLFASRGRPGRPPPLRPVLSPDVVTCHHPSPDLTCGHH